jgi:hypothetical protein
MINILEKFEISQGYQPSGLQNFGRPQHRGAAPPGSPSKQTFFHVMSAVVMSLNTFIWSFVATYPAILWCHAQIRSHLA